MVRSLAQIHTATKGVEVEHNIRHSDSRISHVNTMHK